MSKQIKIPLSKKKLVLLLTGAIGFVAAGLWFIVKPPVVSSPVFGNPLFIFLAGVAAVLFFGICAVYIARKLTDNQPGLVIDETGFTDNSSGVPGGRILWSDVKHISVTEIHRQKLIMIHIKKPLAYIERQQGSPFKRKMMQLNFKMYGTPLSISSNGLQITSDKLLRLLTNHLNKSRQ